MKKLRTLGANAINTRLGFVLLLVLIYWLKTMFAYATDLNLDIEMPFQIVLAVINPLGATLLLLGLALYIKNTKIFYIVETIIYILLVILLFANTVYFREFSDFITISTAMATSKVSAGLGKSALNLFRFTDIAYLFDFILLPILFAFKKLRFDKRPFNKRASFAITAFSIMFMSVNLFMAEINRPQLLSRGFANNYVVRGLGLPAFVAYDAATTYHSHSMRAKSTAKDLKPVEAYVKEHYAKPNDKYYGIAKGRNVIYIHLESFQQFLIDYKLKDSNGVEHTVTPFLNSLYHSNSTLAFSNFFHQVKAGKTSDAETMLETSLFGLDQGSFLVKYGGENTEEAAPDILAQTGGYTSAVFHGNIASFWNRNNAYKQFGYDYFFSQTYFAKPDAENSFQYGLNDKVVMNDSIKYLEQLQQPFYVKYLTVSNHYPYQSLSGDETGFPLADTGDDTINGYFATANYLDSAVKDFFDYLKASGLYDNSVIVLYGDHYGISNSRNPKLAPLLGKDSSTWNSYDNAMLQRVPYMIVVPGMTDGQVIDTYGGEIDALPTLEHLLGIDTSNYIQLGQDLLSPDHEQLVTMRTNGYFVTPKYTSYGGHNYYTQTGEEITNPDAATTAEIKKYKEEAAKQLQISDDIQTGDLLRFYKDSGLKAINASDYSYQDQFAKEKKIEKELGSKSTSLFSENGNQSTQDLFKAPSYKELNSNK